MVVEVTKAESSGAKKYIVKNKKKQPGYYTIESGTEILRPGEWILLDKKPIRVSSELTVTEKV